MTPNRVVLMLLATTAAIAVVVTTGATETTPSNGIRAADHTYQQAQTSEFVRAAARGGRIRITAPLTPAAQPEEITSFQSLGLLSPEEAFQATETFVRVRNSHREKLRHLRSKMDRTDLDDCVREAELVERFESFEALLNCMHEDAYLTVPQATRLRLDLPGHRIYNSYAKKDGQTVHLVVPVPLDDHPDLQHAVDNLQRLESDRAARRVAEFNAKSYGERDRIVQLWLRSRAKQGSLTNAERAEVARYSRVVHRLDVERRLLSAQ